MDQLEPAKADSIDLQFSSGFQCRINGGDVPSFVLYGDGGAIATNPSTLGGLRAGMALIVPLYRQRRGHCDRPMQLQNALSELELAEKLVASGAMSNAEFLKVSQQLKSRLFPEP